MPFVQDTKMLLLRCSSSVTDFKVASTKGVGTTISSSSQLEITSGSDPGGGEVVGQAVAWQEQAVFPGGSVDSWRQPEQREQGVATATGGGHNQAVFNQPG